MSKIHIKNIATLIESCKQNKLYTHIAYIDYNDEAIALYSSDEDLNILCVNQTERIFKYNNPIYITKANLATEEAKLILSVPTDYYILDTDLGIIYPNTNELIFIYVNQSSNIYYKEAICRIMTIVNNIHYYKTNIMASIIDRDITNDETIITMNNNKVKNRQLAYIVDNKYYMTIYKTFLPMLKSDKVTMTIYDSLYIDNTFLSEFIVTKKKGIILKLYYKFVNLI